MKTYPKDLIRLAKRFLNTHDVTGFDRSFCKATNEDAELFLDQPDPRFAAFARKGAR